MINNHYINLLKFLATGFGSGYAKKAPGTAGTLACGVLLYASLILFGQPSLLIKILLAFLVFIVGYLSLKTLSDAGEFSSDQDPGYIVIDEFAGLIVTMCFTEWNALTILLGFCLFRFFDILKPFPIKQIDNKKGPIWVMLDDVLAGIIAGVIVLFIY